MIIAQIALNADPIHSRRVISLNTSREGRPLINCHGKELENSEVVYVDEDNLIYDYKGVPHLLRVNVTSEGAEVELLTFISG